MANPNDEEKTTLPSMVSGHTQDMKLSEQAGAFTPNVGTVE